MADEIVLVTGGAGYIGSQLIRDLAVAPGIAAVRVLDNMQAGRYGGIADLPGEGRFQFLEGDLMDPAAVRRALDGVDAVIHLAALVRTPFSFDYPNWTEHVNHWGTTRLLEQCIEAGTKRFVFASSASVYGTGEALDEEASCSPIGPYSQSKLGGEDAVLAANERGLATTVLRLATVFGYAPSMRFDAVPNRFAYLAAIGRSIPVHGSGEQMRPVIHVADACSALRMAMMDAPAMAGQIYNVVSENVSVAEMAEAAKAIRPFASVRYTAQDVLSRISLSVLGDKLRETGWYPASDLRTGMADILDRFGNFEPFGYPANAQQW